MKPIRTCLCWPALLLLALPLCGLAQTNRPAPLTRWEFTVDGVAREALVHLPPAARTNPAPVVFVFHGHGGSGRNAARSFAIHERWPEAIVVYPQGLNTPGRLVDPEGRRAGWQSRPGDQNDRDLKFFDALLARLKKECRVDEKRIFATGHSNGGAFTYLLWEQRGEVFAALAPSSAPGTGLRTARKLTPKPLMHLAGEKDPLVRYEWQKATMDAVRQINGTASQGVPWDKLCTLYSSTNGTPLVTYIHPGGHEFTPTAAAMIVKFLKEQAAAAK
jgi:polyhydroxybutyrate depolymerase